MINYLIVFVGAGVGGMLRHGVNLGCARYCGTDFPLATLVINIIGSCVMGALIGWLAFRSTGAFTQHLRLFFATGILGGFTTFSTFSLDAVLLWERGDFLNASVYVIGSVLGGIIGLVAALSIMRALS